MPVRLDQRAPENDERQRWKNQCDARIELAFLPNFDQTIAQHRKLETIACEQREFLQSLLRDQYRRATGVEIEDRDRLEQALREAARTGEKSIRQIRDEINFH